MKKGNLQSAVHTAEEQRSDELQFLDDLDKKLWNARVQHELYHHAQEWITARLHSFK